MIVLPLTSPVSRSPFRIQQSAAEGDAEIVVFLSARGHSRASHFVPVVRTAGEEQRR